MNTIRGKETSNFDGFEGGKIMRTRMKELRARYSLTQKDLANLVGVRRETIVFMESGEYNPSLNLANAVAKALKTTIDELFIFED
jgi:putative transcriptional regulator